MKKTIRLTESDLIRIVKRVINEQVFGSKTGIGTTKPGIGTRPKRLGIPKPSSGTSNVTLKNVPQNKQQVTLNVPQNKEQVTLNVPPKTKQVYKKIADDLYNTMKGLSSPFDAKKVEKIIYDNIKNEYDYDGVWDAFGVRDGQNFQQWVDNESFLPKYEEIIHNLTVSGALPF